MTHSSSFNSNLPTTPQTLASLTSHQALSNSKREQHAILEVAHEVFSVTSTQQTPVSPLNDHHISLSLGETSSNNLHPDQLLLGLGENQTPPFADDLSEKELEKPAPPLTPSSFVGAQANLQTGFNIQVIDNHYIDPLNGKLFTINYGGQVARENWQNCTRALVGAASEKVADFLNHHAELGQTLNDVSVYTFDWLSGTILLSLKSGATFQLAAGLDLQDAIKEYLKDSSYLNTAPVPAQMYETLQNIDGDLSQRNKDFLFTVMQDPTLQHRLEEAIVKLKSNPQEDARWLKGYKLILDIARGMNKHAKIHLQDNQARFLENFLEWQPGLLSRVRQAIYQHRIDHTGDRWMRMIRQNFEKNLDRFTSSTARYPIELKLNNDYQPKAQSLANLLLNKPLRVDPKGLNDLHYNIDILAFGGNKNDLNLTADPKRSALHLEPIFNLGNQKEPTWVEIQDVTCIKSVIGERSLECNYIHFVKHDDTWWKIDQTSPNPITPVPWSIVQQASAFQSTRIGLKVQRMPQAFQDSSSYKLLNQNSYTLDYGLTIPSEFKPNKNWSDPSNHLHLKALQDLREYQCQQLLQQPQPEGMTSHPLAPALMANLKNISQPFNGAAFSEEAKNTIIYFFHQLKNSDTPHALAHSISFQELEMMANATACSLHVYTGANSEQMLQFHPLTGPTESAILFSAFHLNPSDPTAKSQLIPLAR